MLSIIVTTKDPLETFKKSFECTYNACLFFINNTLQHIDIELIVISPNIDAYPFLSSYKEKEIPIQILKETGKSKPEAITEAISFATGEYIVLTDGDILLEPKAIKTLYDYTLREDLVIAGGRPTPINEKTTMMGYWAHTLFTGNAHRLRYFTERERRAGKLLFFPVSGYLFIIRKDIYTPTPSHILSEDAYLSYELFQKGYAIGYAERALVYVRFPSTYRDYLAQKVRTIAGHTQKGITESKNRSFIYEAYQGIFATLGYAQSVKEFYWSILLMFSRLHVWLLVMYRFKIKHEKNLWQDIASSKEIGN